MGVGCTWEPLTGAQEAFVLLRAAQVAFTATPLGSQRSTERL